MEIFIFKKLKSNLRMIIKNQTNDILYAFFETIKFLHETFYNENLIFDKF